jgi:hypothetical protein
VQYIEHLIPGLASLPEDTCPTPIAAAVQDADAEVHAAAAAQGLRIAASYSGMMHVLPMFDTSVADAAKSMGVWARRVDLANWLVGYERHRWWNVENAVIGDRS